MQISKKESLERIGRKFERRLNFAVLKGIEKIKTWGGFVYAENIYTDVENEKDLDFIVDEWQKARENLKKQLEENGFEILTFTNIKVIDGPICDKVIQQYIRAVYKGDK